MLRIVIFAAMFFPIATTQCVAKKREPLTWERDPQLCYSDPDTFGYRLSYYDVAVLVRATDGVPDQSDQPASRQFEVVKVAKGDKALVSTGDRIMVPGRREAKDGQLFLLVGGANEKGAKEKITWYGIVSVTSPCFEYIAAAPAPDRPPRERIAYFVGHTESTDPQIRDDAFSELAYIQYEEFLPLAKDLPAEKLRTWLADPGIADQRRNLYALMLGIAGDEQDIDLLLKTIGEPREAFRERLDAAMVGYLHLSGEKGLDYLEQTRLKNQKAPFAETYAAMQAIRLMWRHEPGKIRNEKLQESMRLLLDNPDLADLVIYDLARFKDWSVQDRVMEMYGVPPNNSRPIKRAIVRYLLVCAYDPPNNAAGAVPEHMEKAKRNLANLRKRDPKTVNEAEKFFYLAPKPSNSQVTP
ncbi:MAG: hypothetical protein WD648_10690 [Planctomycetaceae bacterium]